MLHLYSLSFSLLSLLLKWHIWASIHRTAFNIYKSVNFIESSNLKDSCYIYISVRLSYKCTLIIHFYFNFKTADCFSLCWMYSLATREACDYKVYITVWKSWQFALVCKTLHFKSLLNLKHYLIWGISVITKHFACSLLHYLFSILSVMNPGFWGGFWGTGVFFLFLFCFWIFLFCFLCWSLLIYSIL